MTDSIAKRQVEELYARLKKDAESSGYFLNPDMDFTMALVRSLLVNQGRYGYMGCPCRLAKNDKVLDRDIICPCDYRDPDLSQYGCCYCALYVSKEIVQGIKKPRPIPERRTPKRQESGQRGVIAAAGPTRLPVWRCSVCGYLCAREGPPDTCPICKVPKERFERFM